MTFNIIGSSSKGNCCLVNDDLMIDLGLSYEMIKPYASKVKYLLLTHKHSDHLSLTALRKLYVNVKPVIICGEWLKETLSLYAEQVQVVEAGKVYSFGSYKVSPVKAYHDVPNCGYRIMQGIHKHLHITDTATLDGISAKGYDSASIECNHCEVKASKLIQEAIQKGEFTHLEGAMNSHLSVQKAIKFCNENGIKQLIPVHIGESTKSEVLEALRIWNENIK
jgi:phosphoribosyl 1,2-cyclic phosphodiesterase